jgi:Carboxypeptidase regulatory-like domain
MIFVLCLAVMTLGEPSQGGAVGGIRMTPPAAQGPARDTSAAKGTGAIKGKVVDTETGKPMRRVQIGLSSPDLSESRTISTTAQGVFEFKELPAGRYTLTATRPGFIRLQYGQRRPGEPGRPIQLADGQRVADANFALPRTGWITGRITDEVGEPLADVSIYPAQWKYFRGKRRMVPVSGGGPFNRTDDTGQFRITGLEPGDYFILATTRTTWTVDENPDERVGFLPTYSGGVSVPANATPVKVAMGQEASVGDFAMVPGRVASISGTATYSSGLPIAGETINVTQEFAGPGTGTSFGMQGGKVNADGTFLIKNLGPGDYKLSVRGPGDKEHPAEGVTLTVTVTGENVTGIMLVGGSGGSLSGRVVSDTGEAIPQPTTSRMRVFARPVDPTSTYTSFDNDNGRVKDDWTFDLTNVFGQNRLSINPMPTGWAVRRIEHEGKDYADVPVEPRGGQKLDGVTIVLSKTLPRFNGTLLDEAGRPAEGTTLLFPEDSSRWGEDSRLVRTARPDAAGAFEFRNVIPGDYLAVALEYVRDGDWTDPDFLEKLRERASKVKVDERGASAISLKLVKPQ